MIVQTTKDADPEKTLVSVKDFLRTRLSLFETLLRENRVGSQRVLHELVFWTGLVVCFSS